MRQVTDRGQIRVFTACMRTIRTADPPKCLDALERVVAVCACAAITTVQPWNDPVRIVHARLSPPAIGWAERNARTPAQRLPGRAITSDFVLPDR